MPAINYIIHRHDGADENSVRGLACQLLHIYRANLRSHTVRPKIQLSRYKSSSE